MERLVAQNKEMTLMSSTLSTIQKAKTIKKVSCYCRVSTDKDEQLESLSKQMEFFEDFAKREGYELVKVYADEGIKGTQLKNREQFKQMIRDAKKGMFDTIYVKDVSRFARNTEDFLHNIRKIRSFGVEVFFISHNLGIQEGSEMYLTMLAMMAQEESASLSKKVKFGKNITAKKGRVPNFVFGYDKIDRYTLVHNTKEKEIVEKIFELFVNQGYGTARVAGWLNKNNVITKKNKQNNWHQVVVTQILRNEIYIGKIINKKSEVVDFLTGKRRDIPREQWVIVERPELRIISDGMFHKAQELLEEKRDSFKLMNKRESTKYPFSNLIKCSECGYSFRRTQRQYKDGGKVYRRWVDSLRNAKGADACINRVVVDEDELMEAIKAFLQQLTRNKTRIIRTIVNEIKTTVKEQNRDTIKEQQDSQQALNQLIKEKEQYMKMFKEEVITMDELKIYTKDINEHMSKLRVAIHVANNKEVLDINIEKVVTKYFDQIKSIVDSGTYENQFLKTIIDKMTVYPDGSVRIALKIEPTHGLNFDMLLDAIEIPLAEIVPATNDNP
jgi:DNA invertase Pin-like site-specific DNA recombinase